MKFSGKTAEIHLRINNSEAKQYHEKHNNRHINSFHEVLNLFVVYYFIRHIGECSKQNGKRTYWKCRINSR